MARGKRMIEFVFSVVELQEDGEQRVIIQGAIACYSLKEAFKTIAGNHADLLIMENISLTIDSPTESVNWITVYKTK